MPEELGKLPNTLAMEGHTDSKTYAAGNYGNWERPAFLPQAQASVPEQTEVVVLAEAQRILHRPPERFVAAVPLGW